MYLHEDSELFREVLDNTRDMTGLPVRIIEKDYYVTVILKLISLNTEDAVFKGGTSLSKCYHAISRFSEDIDITFTEHIGESRRKHLKYDVMEKISGELGMPIENWDSIQSDRDYNCYYFSYESVEPGETEQMLSSVKLETALASYSFPVNKMTVGGYVSQYLMQENPDILEEYNLQDFDMNVQSLERTFLDKVFALCDYYMQGKSRRYSRHLYDIAKLMPMITMDEAFRELAKKVREHRKQMTICPSAKDGESVPDLIKEFCGNDFFKKDYEEITHYFVSEPVPYRETVRSILGFADTGIV